MRAGTYPAVTSSVSNFFAAGPPGIPPTPPAAGSTEGEHEAQPGCRRRCPRRARRGRVGSARRAAIGRRPPVCREPRPASTRVGRRGDRQEVAVEAAADRRGSPRPVGGRRPADGSGADLRAHMGRRDPGEVGLLGPACGVRTEDETTPAVARRGARRPCPAAYETSTPGTRCRDRGVKAKGRSSGPREGGRG